MKNILLTSVIASAALTVIAATPANDLQRVNASDNLKVTRINNAPAKNVKQIAPGVTSTVENGIKKLHVIGKESRNLQSIKAMRSPIGGVKAPQGFVLFESFEGWDGEDLEWTPEGWTVDMRGEVERSESWTPCLPNTSFGLPAPADGIYSYAINYSEVKQDEWLITPEIEIAEGFNLSYWLYLDPVFLFNLTEESVDWNNMEFIGEPTVSATLQIWAQPAGEEWIMLHDYVDDYTGMTLLELFDETPSGMEKKSMSLDKIAGKKAKIAFRYVGIDGNSMFIDAVGVGYPALEDVSYLDPFSTLYWGFTRSASLTCLTADIAMYPVYAPLTWTNMTYIDGAEYEWTYCDPVTADFVTDNNPEALTVTYIPDYSSEASMRNNFFYPPTLTASAPNSTPGSYTAPYVYFQAGGKVERTLNDGTEFEATLFPFALNNSGFTFITCDDETIGDNAIPVFGYNNHTDQYWLNYSLNGAEPMEGNYSHLEGIANLFMATEAPLVVNGITAFGWGKVDPEAEFTATIYALDSEMSAAYESLTEIASTTLKGSEFIAQYNDAKGYLCLPFNFDEPVVISATEEHPAYFIMIKGFRSDKVEYFVPLQSAKPDPNYMCLGYIMNHIDLSGHTDRGEYYSIKPMVYKADGDYVDPYASFAIGLDAEYPWLTTDTEEITLSSTPVEVQLGSYYDGSKLSVEVPAGVEATVTGRYNKCVLTVKHNNADVIAEGNVVVKGPGVEVSIPVKEGTVGISGITAENEAEITGIYDLNGRRINAADAKDGIYVVKYSDGTARKTVVRK